MQIVKLVETNYTHIEKIDSPELFEEVSAYRDTLISEAANNEALAEQELKNVYMPEIARLSLLCADFKANYIAPAILERKRLVRGVKMGNTLFLLMLLLFLVCLVVYILSQTGVLEEHINIGSIIIFAIQVVCMFMLRHSNVKALRKFDTEKWLPKVKMEI